MNKEVRNKIKQLCDEITFEPDWTTKIWLDVLDISCSDKLIDSLPEKLRTVFLLANLKNTISCDGFLSVFYNESLYEIKRLRRAIELSGSQELGNLFDEAFQLVKSKFTWLNKIMNFIGQTSDDPYEFFGNKITDRIEEIETKISDIIYEDDFEKHLEAYMKSQP